MHDFIAPPYAYFFYSTPHALYRAACSCSLLPAWKMLKAGKHGSHADVWKTLKTCKSWKTCIGVMKTWKNDASASRSAVHAKSTRAQFLAIYLNSKNTAFVKEATRQSMRLDPACTARPGSLARSTIQTDSYRQADTLCPCWAGKSCSLVLGSFPLP